MTIQQGNSAALPAGQKEIGGCGGGSKVEEGIKKSSAVNLWRFKAS